MWAFPIFESTPNDLGQDSRYMKKWYEMEFCESLAVRDLHGRDESNRVAEAKDVFKPCVLLTRISFRFLISQQDVSHKASA